MFIRKKEYLETVRRIEHLEDLVDYLLNLTDKKRIYGESLKLEDNSEIIDEWLNGKKKTTFDEKNGGR